MSTEKGKFKHIDNRLLDRYLELLESNEDQLKIEEWFTDLQANEELRKYSKRKWDGLAYPDETDLSGYDEERIHNRIHHLLRLEEAANLPKARTWTKVIRIITRAAAVLFIPLALFTLLFLRGNLAEKRSVARAELFSPLGSRTSFELPDGSTGWLNGGSTLSFPTQFSRKTRTVKLSGEAYFDIVSNPKRPFTVLTGDLKVKAYGTSFNVLAYPEDMTMEVTLESGVVEVTKDVPGNTDKSLGRLDPGERGVYIPGTGYFKKDPVEVDLYTSWKEGKLVLRHEPMIQMVRKLNRWYNVNMVIKDSHLDTYNYRATFEDEVLDEVLTILKHTSNISFKELEEKGTLMAPMENEPSNCIVVTKDMLIINPITINYMI
jgi:transmembrane sensor